MQIINLKQAQELGITDLYVSAVNGFGDMIMFGSAARALARETGRPILLGVRPGNENFLYGADESIYVFPGLFSQKVNKKSASCIMKRYGIRTHYIHLANGYRVARESAAPGNLPLTAQLAKNIGVTAEFADLSPKLGIRCEIERFIKDRPQVTIMTGGFPGKAVPVRKMQAVVDAMPDVGFVHIGLPDDPYLRGVMDMRGKLKFFDEIPAALAQSDVFVCSEGGLMHIAAAVGTRYVVGDAHGIPVTKYNAGIHVLPDVKLPKPFRKHYTLDLNYLPVDKMIDAVRAQLADLGNPIAPDITDMRPYVKSVKKIRGHNALTFGFEMARCGIFAVVASVVKKPMLLERVRIRDWPRGTYSRRVKMYWEYIKDYLSGYRDL